MVRYAIDTNVLTRYIVEDNPEQAQKATEVIEQLTTEKQGFISCIVLCELNWVLKTAYNPHSAPQLSHYLLAST